MPESATFSDYLVFVDETGDHSLTSIDPLYPVFVLACAVIRKSEYVHQVRRDLQAFKMRHWGHDETVLHEHEIRKPRNAFSFLLQKKIRERFMGELTSLMEALPATIVAVVIDKPGFAERHAEAHPGAFMTTPWRSESRPCSVVSRRRGRRTASLR